MATAIKSSRTVQASASNSAAGTTTSSALDLTTAFGATLTAKVTNGATGPTVACDFVVQVSHDNSAYKEFSRQTSATGNNIVTEFAVEIPPSVMYLKSVFTGNTGQAVTVECFAQELTSIG